MYRTRTVYLGSVHAHLIMLSLPLSLVGVCFAPLLTDDTLNIMWMIGIIMLLGPVTKNAVLLVDHANERRAKGQGQRTARWPTVTSTISVCGSVNLRREIKPGLFQ